jgi:hypothetical protein
MGRQNAKLFGAIKTLAEKPTLKRPLEVLGVDMRTTIK